MFDKLLNFAVDLLPIAAGFVPATLYQVKFKKELSVAYSVCGSLVIGAAWWWWLYDLKISQESILMIMLITLGSYLIFRFEERQT